MSASPNRKSGLTKHTRSCARCAGAASPACGSSPATPTRGSGERYPRSSKGPPGSAASCTSCGTAAARRGRGSCGSAWPASPRRRSGSGTPPWCVRRTTWPARCSGDAAPAPHACWRRPSPTRSPTWTSRRRIGSACAPTTCRSVPTARSSGAAVSCRCSRRRSRWNALSERYCAKSTKSGGGGATSRRTRWPSFTPASRRRSPWERRPSPS